MIVMKSTHENAAVQRLVEETGDGLNVYEITEVQKAD